jgi:hypothetical protein
LLNGTKKMNDPEPTIHDTAGGIVSCCVEDLAALGLDQVEAAQFLIRMALEILPSGVCPHCVLTGVLLEGEDDGDQALH